MFFQEAGALQDLQRFYMQRNLRLVNFFSAEIAKHKSYKKLTSEKSCIISHKITKHGLIGSIWTFFEITCFFMKQELCRIFKDVVCKEIWDLLNFFLQRSQSTNRTKNQHPKNRALWAIKLPKCELIVSFWTFFEITCFFMKQELCRIFKDFMCKEIWYLLNFFCRSSQTKNHTKTQYTGIVHWMIQIR